MRPTTRALLERAEASRGGYLTTTDLRAAGIDSRAAARAVDAGMLRSLRRGAYALATAYDERTAVDRHRLLARVVLDRLGPQYAACHVTACALLGLELYDLPLDLVHVVRRGGSSGRRRAGVRVHRGDATAAEVGVVDGCAVVTPVRAVQEVVADTGTSLDAAAVLAWSAQRIGITAERLATPRIAVTRAGSAILDAVRTVGDPRCESVGEVRVMALCWNAGIELPTPQVELRTSDGRWVARVDFCWEELGHVLEFDGAMKYGRLNRYADTEPGRVLVDEKRREDAVRALGYGMTRLVWSDLAPRNARRTADVIRDALAQSRRRFEGR